MESGTLNDLVEVEATDLIGGATMGLTDGEVLSVREHLWGMLVPSGNDAAMALARWIGGDVDSFVERMNARAADLGMSESHFVNPHGFDAEGHVMSVSDLLTLSLKLMEYPLFNEIVQSAEIEVAGRLLQNTNEFLGYYPGVVGLKTGTTQLAGQCLVTHIQIDDKDLLILVLGSDDRYSDVANLHQLYTDNYEWVTTNFDELSVMNRLYAGDGKVIPIQVADGVHTTLRHRWGDPEVLLFRQLTYDLPVAGSGVDSDEAKASTLSETSVSAADAANDLQKAEKVGAAIWRFGDEVLVEQEMTVQ